MRIRRRDHGGRSGGDLGGHEERARRFRTTHQVGDVVPGQLMGWHGPELAWVRLDGQPLLARLPAETPHGARLRFLVTALAPEIVLKLLPGQSAGADQGGLTAAFIAARAALESSLEPLPVPPARRAAGSGTLETHDAAEKGAETPVRDRRAAWLRMVAADRRLLGLFAQVMAALARLNATLPAHARLAYAPWLAPGLRQTEILLRRHPRPGEPEFLDLLLAGSRIGTGAVQVRTLAKAERISVRVMAEQEGQVRHLEPLLRRVVEGDEAPAGPDGQPPGPGIRPVFLGLEPLPRSLRGGALADLARP